MHRLRCTIGSGLVHFHFDGNLTILLAAIFTTSKAEVPNYSPAIGGNAALARDEVIQTYFNLGFKAQEIILFLVSVYGTRIISVRHLKRILRRLSCSRRRFQSNLDDTTVYKGERFEKKNHSHYQNISQAD